MRQVLASFKQAFGPAPFKVIMCLYCAKEQLGLFLNQGQQKIRFFLNESPFGKKEFLYSSRYSISLIHRFIASLFSKLSEDLALPPGLCRTRRGWGIDEQASAKKAGREEAISV